MVWGIPTRRGHSHSGENSRLQIFDKVKIESKRCSIYTLCCVCKRHLLKQGDHTRIWNFLRRGLKRFSCILQMHDEITDSEKLNRIYFAQYCRNELRDDSFLMLIFIQWLQVPNFPELRTNKPAGFWGSGLPPKVYRTLQNFPCTIGWRVPSRNEVTGQFFKNWKGHKRAIKICLAVMHFQTSRISRRLDFSAGLCSSSFCF